MSINVYASFDSLKYSVSFNVKSQSILSNDWICFNSRHRILTWHVLIRAKLNILCHFLTEIFSKFCFVFQFSYWEIMFWNIEQKYDSFWHFVIYARNRSEAIRIKLLLFEYLMIENFWEKLIRKWFQFQHIQRIEIWD